MKARIAFAVGIITMIAMIAVLAVGPARGAWASPPVRERDHYSFSYVSAWWSSTCGFPVTRSYDEYYTDAYFTQENGVVRENFIQHGTETFSAEGGGNITGRIQGPFIDTFYPDGTETWMQAGQMQRFTVPGYGLIYGGSGSDFIQFDTDGNVVTETQSGPLVDNAQAICDAIEP